MSLSIRNLRFRRSLQPYKKEVLPLRAIYSRSCSKGVDTWRSANMASYCLKSILNLRLSAGYLHSHRRWDTMNSYGS